MLDYIKKSNYTELSMINTSNSHKTHGLIIPSVADTQLSQISSEALTSSFQRASISAQKIKLVDSNGNEKVIDIPLVACQLLADTAVSTFMRYNFTPPTPLTKGGLDGPPLNKGG